jgi:hypothetical protein
MVMVTTKGGGNIGGVTTVTGREHVSKYEYW